MRLLVVQQRARVPVRASALVTPATGEGETERERTKGGKKRAKGNRKKRTRGQARPLQPRRYNIKSIHSGNPSHGGFAVCACVAFQAERLISACNASAPNPRETNIFLTNLPLINEFSAESGNTRPKLCLGGAHGAPATVQISSQSLLSLSLSLASRA